MAKRSLMPGILTGLNKAQDRATKLKAARDTNRRNNELFDLQKKKAELTIQEKEATGQITKVFSDAMLKDLKDATKARDAKSKIQDTQVNRAESNIKDTTNKLLNLGKNVMANERQDALSAITSRLDERGISMKFNPSSGFSFGTKTKTKTTDIQDFRSTAQKFIAGNISEDQFRNAFPEAASQDEIDIIIDERTPVKVNPDFKRGSGVGALASPNIANITPQMEGVIRTIKTQGDLDFVLTDPTYRGKLQKSFGTDFLDQLDRTLKEVFQFEDIDTFLNDIGEFGEL